MPPNFYEPALRYEQHRTLLLRGSAPKTKFNPHPERVKQRQPPTAATTDQAMPCPIHAFRTPEPDSFEWRGPYSGAPALLVARDLPD